ncbi:peptidoglycan-binding domain-containing protein [Streptomyces sp. NPDC005408]|uniref:peptidoglycan-binding domain-containing protein n=1 Tax=Streptomyces sp. NPDC005408 TaxID=3155341 RepID=UPI0033B21534
MKRKMSVIRRAATAAAVAALLTGGTMATAPSASASVSQGSVYGAGDVWDDWRDEGPLDSNSHDYSRAVALWQLVLRVEGLYSGAIDCDFGPATTAATRAFQTRYSLEVDGSAGPQTMGLAGQKGLVDMGNNVVRWDYTNEKYVNFKRVNGVYYAYFNGAWRSASYTSASGC